MKTHVEFRSDQFPPCEGEEEQTNPGLYGKRLADFLVANLPANGFQPKPPIPEDWGWLIPIENEGFTLSIGCGRYDDHADGFLCFIEPHEETIFRWFRRVDATGPVGALQRALDQILSSHAGITDVRWSTYADFIRPK